MALPWVFEHFADYKLPGPEHLRDPAADHWMRSVWPWWRAQFAAGRDDLTGVLANVKAARAGEERKERRDEARPVVEAALLMLMLDTVTRELTGPEAAKAEYRYRDNLVNVREGDLAAFIKYLTAWGATDETRFNSFKAGDLRTAYRWNEIGEFHEDLIRYLFQQELMESEVTGLWLSEFDDFMRNETTFPDAIYYLAQRFIVYCFGTPLRRLRVMIRASNPLVPLVRQCGLLMDEFEAGAWDQLLTALMTHFSLRLRVEDVPLSFVAKWMLSFLNGEVSRLATSTVPDSDDQIDTAAFGFVFAFRTLFVVAEPESTEEENEQADVPAPDGADSTEEPGAEDDIETAPQSDDS